MLRRHETTVREFDRRRIFRWLRTGGIRRKLLTLIVFLAIVVALLPLLVAKTPLLNALLASAIPRDAMRLTVHDASLSWISGPSLSGIEAKDAAGNVLLIADSVSVSRAPSNLIMNSRDLGVIKIVHPTIYLKIRPNGTNLEDVAQKLMSEISAGAVDSPADATPSAPLRFSVELSAGTILAEDVATGRQWRIEKVDLHYDAGNGSLGQGSLIGEIVDGGVRGASAGPTGRFAVSLKPGNAGREELNLQLEGLSLLPLEPLLHRFVVGSELNGTLSGQGTASWTASASTFPNDITSTGTLSIDRLDVTAPALQSDRIRLARVELPWKISSQPTGLAIENVQVRTDVGQIALRGKVDSSALAKPQAAWSNSAAKHDLEVRGAIDVARLAAMLPHVLKIRSDTTITSGTIEMAGRYQPSDAGQIVTGSVRTAQLAATSAGKPLSWDQPVTANFALRRENGLMQLDALHCDSQFLKVDAAGTPQQFTASANFDLNSLAEQLGQFVDLSGKQLAGTGTARIDWKQEATDKFTAAASGDLAQLRVALGDGAVWAEPQFTLRAEATGLLDPISHRPIRVDTAQLQVSGQGDQLDARLTGAVGLTNPTPVWPVAIRSSGSIARWLTRVRPWFTPDPWQIDGVSEFVATVQLGSNTFEATNTKLTVTDLRATSPGWNVNESRVELVGDAHWNGATGELAANSVQLVSSTVSFATKDVRYRNGDQSISQMAGVAAFRADLARLAAWRAVPNQAPHYQPSGEFSGNIRFAQQAGRISGDITATGTNMTLASRGVPAPGTSAPAAPRPAPSGYQIIWQEPKLTLHSTTTYDAATDRLAFDQLSIQSNTLQATAAGQIERLSTAADCNITGSLNYDLAQVTPLLRPYIGNGIQLAGREQARFAVAGKLTDETGPRAQLTSAPISDPYKSTIGSPQSASHWSRRVRAQLELPWSGANVYGLPVGPGRLAAALGDGSLRIEPLSLAVGEGRLTAAPNVRFDPQPSELTMPAGPVITNVRISPEVSEAMLKFVAPVLAGSTQSEGLFSLKLDGARVPLAEPKRADSAGQLTVHSVRVVPGAMAKELIGLGQQIEALAKRRDPTALASRQPVTLLAIRDQQVNFRVTEGRVYHQNMEFQVGDVTFRSQGSVGLDETVSLMLQIPVQDAWVAKEPLLAGLKGQSLQVPVSGTLTRPQLDQRALTNLSGQLIQNAAGQAIGGELNKALDKFLKPQ